MKKLFFIICFSLAISGCATLSLLTEERVKTFTDEQIYSRHVAPGWGARGRSMVSDKDKAVLRAEMVRRHPEWPVDIKEVVLRGTIHIGMTKEQVKANWGKPNSINRSAGSWGVHEQWVYNWWSEYEGYYLYFENGILASWQD